MCWQLARSNLPRFVVPRAARALAVMSSSEDAHSRYRVTELERSAARHIPKLLASHRKGDMGKVVVIGGCEEYTGAPFFAANAALKMGADLVHVFCTQGAGPVIKSYSPELIVHPYLSEKSSTTTVMKKVMPWIDTLSKNTCIIVGPGLGRHPKIVEQAKEILLQFNDREVPAILDADALWFLSEDADFIDQLFPEFLVMTPNQGERLRLMKADLSEDCLDSTFVVKGEIDALYCAGVTTRCTLRGSSRRVGGQGDVLTGCIATFVAWNFRPDKKAGKDTGKDTGKDAGVDANDDDEGVWNPTKESILKKNMINWALAGCTVTRMASRRAFRRHHRAMGANDLISELGSVIHDLENIRDA